MKFKNKGGHRMDGFTTFWNKYGGAFFGLIMGIFLAILIVFTNFYKIILAIALVIACIWLGGYVQRNKEAVKEKTKNFIDKL